MTFFPYLTSDTTTFTVNEKERVNDGSSSTYLIFTDNETFENKDCWVKGKFSSSDLYGSLKEGETYTAEVYGWRVPFLSMYRNVVEVKLTTE